MIALVAAWSTTAGAAARPRAAVAADAHRPAAARVKALLQDARNTEIVTFADKRLKPVRVMRGGLVVAAVSIAVRPPPARPPVRVDVQVVSFANPLMHPVTVLRGMPVARLDLFALNASPGNFNANPGNLGLFGAASGADLDRVVFAVDGVESSHGADPAMWRPELDGPQGPMQVSAAAASDSGGGDRFDLSENRLLGRTYLARLYRRYGNWPDAVAAYNWGPGNLDLWIAQGRPAAGLPLEVGRYRDRVLRDCGMLPGPTGTGVLLPRHGWQLLAP